MLEVAEARKRLLAHFSKGPVEVINFLDSAGRVLAETVTAGINSPPFTHSAMDGVAVRAEDLTAGRVGKPTRLKVIGNITAGVAEVGKRVEEGEAALIMTGAPLPVGADAVVRVEDTNLNFSNEEIPPIVEIYRVEGVGANIRFLGENFQIGTEIIPAGKTILPQDIGMMATLGISEISVVQKPLVGIIASGNELVEPGTPLKQGQIWNSNSHMISALVRNCGAEVIDLGIIPDTEAAIYEAMNKLNSHPVDLILTSGGVSMGIQDFIRRVLEQHGQLNFWKVNMRPGKPLAFGHFEQTPFVGLPGNPVSSFIASLIFVCPAIKKMLGKPEAAPRFSEAVLGEDLDLDGRESYLPALFSGTKDASAVVPVGNQSSGNLFALVQANCLIKTPPGVQSLKRNSMVDIWIFD